MKTKKKTITKTINFVGSFFAALSIVAQFFPKHFALLNQIPGANKIVFVLVVILLICLFIMNLKRCIEEYEEKLKIEHKAIHDFAHLIRDTSYKADLIGDDTHNFSSLYHLLKTFSDGVVACIHQTICAILNTDATKDNVSVCIKVLDLQKWDNSKIINRPNAKYFTISRNYISKGALQRDDTIKHSISEDTSFTRIFVEGKHDWTGLNLSKPNNTEIISEDTLEERIEFKDPCDNWREHYSNRIVVPIRVKLSEINAEYFQSDERNLFGFICVEYKKSKTLKITSKDDKDLISILDLLKTFADTMYVVYDKINGKMNLPSKAEKDE